MMERRISAMISSRIILGLIILAVIIGGALLFWAYTPGGKTHRLADMREECAAGLIAPNECIRNGVPIRWEIDE